jgi:nucleotide-binding universal stress UspA family protein
MIERILVPTDFSEPSLAAVRYALELADAVGGRIILLHGIEGEPVHSYMVGGPPPFLRDESTPDRGLSPWQEPQEAVVLHTNAAAVVMSMFTAMSWFVPRRIWASHAVVQR